MKLTCLICEAEVTVEGDSLNKKVECLSCGFSNANKKQKAEPEIYVIRKR